MQLVKIQD